MIAAPNRSAENVNATKSCQFHDMRPSISAYNPDRRDEFRRDGVRSDIFRFA